MKYAVITYIFGKNQEIFREPKVIDENIEYICVTDQKDLTSKYWKIIYDNIDEAKCIRDKMVYVKYRPFNYTNADKVLVIDGSLEIKSSLIPLFEQLKNNDILIKKHPERDNLHIELLQWIKTRGMSSSALTKFEIMATKNNINLKTIFLLESCIILYSNKDVVKTLCDKEISYMKFLGDKTLFLSNQCVLTFLLETENKNIKFDYLDQLSYFTRYKRNSKELANR